MTNTDAVRVFLALGQETRLNVFRLIVQKGDTGIRPSQLGELLDVTSATLSFNLKKVPQSNLVMGECQSTNLIIRPRADVVEDLMEFLLFNCCGGKDCCTIKLKKA
jgi:hypothetical protein